MGLLDSRESAFVEIISRPAESFDLGVAVLRRHHPDDAPGLAAAVRESMVELQPWMPWASSVAADPGFQRPRLDEVHARWDDGSEFSYVILTGAGEVIGSIGLHVRIGPGALEIGYWIHSAHTGQGIATAAARALTSAALALPEIQRVEIHCDEANVRSIDIPRRLAYRLDRIIDEEPTAPGESGKLMIWAMPAQPATAVWSTTEASPV